MPLLIAIDGPVGAGKSTISEEVARRLSILHLDTGAMYRAAGLAAIRAGASLDDEEAVSAAVLKADITVAYVDSAQRTYLNGEDVSKAIRTEQAGDAASRVSCYKAVRKRMVDAQRALAKNTSMLLDGRDIGTIVLPEATAKIYLTASREARAKRRMNQLRLAGDKTPYDEILKDIISRDERDVNREVDPLRKASDAVTVDSSKLTFEQTVQSILRIVEDKIHG